MNRPNPAGDYFEHFDPELPHHRAWFLAVLEQLVAHESQALEEGGTLRRLWTAHQAAAGAATAPVADIPAAVAVALPLVKEFEGCRLEAYPDPETGGEPWAIGWGSTTQWRHHRCQHSDSGPRRVRCQRPAATSTADRCSGPQAQGTG